ncbi:MAG: patatin-like protein [Oscillatoriophycideae cyanobacterium NC_groundwater_1537_Pr4_S-0.65um_50_18]|nr:patatin-like protein [Oscillatoriophycideae cyanobacterium NC_groundwater_1537_Pr4_S-0.65um_50_18]
MSESTSKTGSTTSHIPFRQEFRLGLVVYGGVSLAVYMNGVCREFYNAVRGRGIYKLLKALTDSDIIVDVLSGTSAGGINGVLLSYALTNSTEGKGEEKGKVFDFKDFADVWRESGNISQLLREPEEPLSSAQAFPSGKAVDSILDGDNYYQSQLTNAFQTVWNNSAEPIVGEWFSPSSELDLFITGTDLLGKVYKAFDNTGSLIEVKEHRTVFHLKYREGRKHDFQPARDQIPQKALAKLCRITSCFPVAFPVVSVQLKSEDAIDRHLISWGQLENRELPSTPPPKGYQLHFVDGGVLDNRPFSYTINEIYRRTAYRPAARKMFYIDPSPDQFLNSPKFRNMQRPSILQAATDSLVGMPRYESIANDLKEISDRNEKVRRYKFLRATAQRAVEEDKQPGNADENSRKVYLRCRLVGLRDRILPLILRIDSVDLEDQATRNEDKSKLLERAAELMTQYVADKEGRDAREEFLNKLSDEIRNLDIDYALRKHFFLLEKICELMGRSQENEEHQKLANLAGNLGLQIQLLETIQAGLDRLLQMKPISQVFYGLIERDLTLPLERQPANQRQIYDFLLKMHRFFLDNDLDGDGLPPSKPIADRAIADQDVKAIAPHFFDTYDPAQCANSERTSILDRLLEKSERLGKLLETGDRLGDDLDSDASRYFWNNDRYKFNKDSENDSDKYRSFLRRIEQASEQLIEAANLTLKEGDSKEKDLAVLFKRFRDIDQAVYSFEYLSDIQAKEQIEIIRISPADAQKGYGKDKGLIEKLAGDQFRAFGGFFKKSWRSNDILWGRLDGVNRIIEALLTPKALLAFPGFLQRQIESLNQQDPSLNVTPEGYLTELIQETLPQATAIQKQTVLQSLLELCDLCKVLMDQERADQKPTRKQTLELQEFAQKLIPELQEIMITAEHRAIVQSELGYVLEDAIDEQLEWNQQQIKPTKETSKLLTQFHYKPVSVKHLEGDELKAVKQLDHLVKNVVDPKLLSGVANSLGLLSTSTQSLVGQPGREETDQGIHWAQLPDLMHIAFRHSSQSDRRKLSDYLLPIVQTKTPAVDDFYRFFNQLLLATSHELSYSTSSQNFKAALKDIEQQLRKIVAQLRPTFQPVGGYFDRAITPFVATELARTSTQSLLQNGDVDAYFRNKYRVGSENLADAIPPLILQNLAAQVGMILRNVLVTSSVGPQVRPTVAYKIFNASLNLFYWAVRSKNSKSRLRAGSLAAILELIFLVAIAAITVILISKIPFGLMVILLSVPALGLIFYIWRLLTKR